MSKYYSVVDAYFQDNPNEDFMLPIKWNINKLSGRPNSSGFIVQHMSIQSSDSCIPSNDYFEAWLVMVSTRWKSFARGQESSLG